MIMTYSINGTMKIEQEMAMLSVIPMITPVKIPSIPLPSRKVLKSSVA
jgi:hypothetical protein